MKLRAGVLALVLISPHAGHVQELPPGTILLSTVKRHLKKEIATLPNYTCLETAQRLHKAPGARNVLKPVDVLRLEVLNTGHHEMYAAPGETDFREDSPFAFSVSGLTASGLFGGFVQTLFVQDNGAFTFRGEEKGQPGGDGVAQVGRRIVRWDYRVPLLTSGWHLQVANAGDFVAMKGSIWVDEESLDLVRLTVHADDIPGALEVSDATIILDYARTRIGEVDVLLPQTGEVSMLHTSGEMSRNILEYTHCRSFQAKSTMSFAVSSVSFDPPAAGTPAPPAPPKVLPLPGGLPLTVRLQTKITEKQSVGTFLEGTVAADVMERNKVLIPAGARVTGRLRRLDRNQQSDGYTLAMEFTEIVTEQNTYRFYADIQSVAGDPTAEAIPDGLSTRPLPGVGFLFVRGPRFTLQPGFRLIWKTRPPAR